MANAETSFGLRPVGLVGSGANRLCLTQYETLVTTLNAIYNGLLFHWPQV